MNIYLSFDVLWCIFILYVYYGLRLSEGKKLVIILERCCHHLHCFLNVVSTEHVMEDIHF